MSHKRVVKTKSVKKSGRKKSVQSISKKKLDKSKLMSLIRELRATRNTMLPSNVMYSESKLPGLKKEIEKISKVLERELVHEALRKDFGWNSLFATYDNDIHGIFINYTKVAGYSPNRIKRKESDFTFAEGYYSVPINKVKKIITECNFLGLEYAVIDGSAYSLTYLEPLLKASEKIGFKNFRIDGTQMPLWLEHKEGVIALAPRILVSGDIRDSNKLPNAVRQLKVKLDSSIEMIVYRKKGMNTDALMKELKEVREYEHFNKRELLTMISETVAKSKSLKFAEGNKQGIIPKTKAKIIDIGQIPEAPKKTEELQKAKNIVDEDFDDSYLFEG